MHPDPTEYTPAEIDEQMEVYGLSPRLKDYVNRTAVFHTYASPGALIGVFMVDYALELLGASPEEKLFAVCETHKCAPDAVQVIAGCTIGNNRLRLVPIGKFALTISRGSRGSMTEGVRVFVDTPKMKPYPVLDAWYHNTSAFDKHTMKKILVDDIFRAGRQILAAERIKIRVGKKQKWSSVICSSCGEPVPDYLCEGGVCAGCRSPGYYEKVV